MKKVVGAIILALISVAACAFSLFYIEDTSNTALSYVSKIQNQIQKDDYKTAEQSAKNLEKFWDEQNETLATFVHHEMLEEIGESIRSVNVILGGFEEEEKVNLQVECKKTQTLLENFKDSEMPTITNIL